MPRLEYQVIESHEVIFLEEQVNAEIQEGWAPLGGVNMARNEPGQDSGFYRGGERYEIWYSQAMTRRRRLWSRLNPELTSS